MSGGFVFFVIQALVFHIFFSFETQIHYQHIFVSNWIICNAKYQSVIVVLLLTIFFIFLLFVQLFVYRYMYGVHSGRLHVYLFVKFAEGHSFLGYVKRLCLRTLLLFCNYNHFIVSLFCIFLNLVFRKKDCLQIVCLAVVFLSSIHSE